MLLGSDADPFGTFKDRSGFQHHAFSSAERPVIDGAVAIVREGPQVMGNHLHGAHTDGAAENTVLKRTGEEPRKNGQNVEVHGN